jgi:hypothetical protein
MIGSFFRALGNAVYVFFDFLGHLIAAIIDRFGKAIMWVWAFLLLSIVTLAFTFFLFASGLQKVDDTRWNETVLENFTPIIQSIIDVEKDDFQEDLLKDIEAYKNKKEALENIDTMIEEAEAKAVTDLQVGDSF